MKLVAIFLGIVSVGAGALTQIMGIFSWWQGSSKAGELTTAGTGQVMLGLIFLALVRPAWFGRGAR